MPEHQPPSFDQSQREARAGADHPDHSRPRDNSNTQRLDAPDKSSEQLNREADQRRFAREEEFNRTAPVAGHDFRREWAERERSR